MTAIEWLNYELDTELELYNSQWDKINKILEQAKEMEKQQIIKFTNDFIDKHTYGDYDGNVQKNKTIEKYYNKTFNKNE